MVEMLYFYMNLLRLFFLFLLPVAVFGRTYNFFFAYISSFVTQDVVTKIRLLATQAKVFVEATLIVKFRTCECDIPCGLEKIVMTDLSALITHLPRSRGKL